MTSSKGRAGRGSGESGDDVDLGGQDTFSERKDIFWFDEDVRLAMNQSHDTLLIGVEHNPRPRLMWVTFNMAWGDCPPLLFLLSQRRFFRWLFPYRCVKFGFDGV